MGRRGPAPTPTALKIARGVSPYRINADEPKPVEGELTPVIALDGLGQAEWDRILPILESSGVLSLGDATALTVYCVAFSDWGASRRDVLDRGSTLFSNDGKSYPNPSVKLASKALDVMTRMLKEFGLTPSSRSSVKVDAKPAEDEIEQFRKRRRRPPG